MNPRTPNIDSPAAIRPPFHRSKIAMAALASLVLSNARAQEDMRFYVRQYYVTGAKTLDKLDVETAVYPYLGPARSPEDVEKARQALETAYHDKGYQTVSVQIPPQDPGRGVIRLEVVEGKIGRVRVNGARWFLPSRIKAELPSLAEGKVPNLNEVSDEVVAANRIPERRITPELTPGAVPGTYDIDLNVEDESPLHGSIELNNRYSSNTTPLRLNGSLSYGNLWQRGHTLGLSAQIAPENPDDALVFSGYYLARIADKTSLMVTATRQDSDISTLGGSAVAAPGTSLGATFLFDLPTAENFYQNFSLGISWNDYDENINFGGAVVSAPIEYYPIRGTYGASWLGEDRFTEMSVSANLHLRGMGGGTREWDNKRFNADGNFLYLRADASHTQDLDNGAQAYVKVQGQLSNRPLINSEQIAGGGLGNARGYLEATALGDNGVFGTAELRSPTLIGRKPAPGGKNPVIEESTAADDDEWRFHAFTDLGLLSIHDSLPGQKKEAGFASVGIGSRLRYRKHYHASIDLALPLIEQLPDTDNGDWRITFRGWADF